MADTLIAFPQCGKSGGQTIPIKAVDQLDGTFAIKTATASGGAGDKTICFSSAAIQGCVPIRAADNLDGSFSLGVA